MTLNLFPLLRRILFIYQQELYDSNKLLSFFYSKRILENPEKRQKLEWTIKTKPYYIITLGLFLLVYFSMLFQFWWQSNIILFLFKSISLYFLLLFFLPFFLITSQVVLNPLDYFLKQKRIKKAKERYLKYKENLKVIAITGSFGKTSVKELLQDILKEKYSVISTPENKNTPLGFCEFVDTISASHQILIVEMGAYMKGDIQEMCDLVKPDYGVLTGINEQHLERFGSFQNIIEAKNELSSSIPESGILWVNGENKTAKDSAPKYAKCEIEFYNTNAVEDIQYSDDGSQIVTLKQENKKKNCHSELVSESRKASIDSALEIPDQVRDDSPLEISIPSPFLADYFPVLCDLAFKVGRSFSVGEKSIVKALSQMKPAPHRLSPTYYKGTDILIIDDSYNGNSDGALAAMKTLARFHNKHRIYLTPGLVELGDKSSEVHEMLGKNLAFNCDEVWLIQTSVTDSILRGLKKSKFDESKIRIFSKDTDAHRAMRNELKSGTVLLIQNDWTDNYC